MPHVGARGKTNRGLALCGLENGVSAFGRSYVGIWSEASGLKSRINLAHGGVWQGFVKDGIGGGLSVWLVDWCSATGRPGYLVRSVFRVS